MYSRNINGQNKLLARLTCISQTFEGCNKADCGLSTFTFLFAEGKKPNNVNRYRWEKETCERKERFDRPEVE
jgi:hypothetical protein